MKGARKRVSRNLTPYIYLFPPLLYLFTFVAYPVGYAVGLSFNSLRPIESFEPSFIGLDNYRALFMDERFFQFLQNSILFVIGSNVLMLGLGLGAALVANEPTKGRAIWRGLLMIPWLLPIVVVGIVWRFIFDPMWGILNRLLLDLGFIVEAINWLGDSEMVWSAILIANTWRGYPFFYINFLAALQTIPEDMYDSGKIDGAGVLNRFRYLTFNWLKFPLIIVLLLNTVYMWDSFAVIWVLTKGGPGSASMTLATYIYVAAFEFWRFGYAASIGGFMLIIMIIFTLLYLHVTFKRGE